MHPRLPLLLTAASATCFAGMALAAKLAALSGLSGSQIAFLRFVMMLAPLLAVPSIARRAVTFHRPGLLVVRGLCGGVAVLLFFLAIEHVPVGLATLLNYSSPIWSVAFAALFLGERADRRLLPAAAAALVGLLLAAGVGGSTLLPGRWELAGLASSVLAGAAVAAIRAARRTEGSWAIYGSFTLFGLLATAPFGLAAYRAPTAHQWALLAAVGVTSVAAQLLMTYAYRWVTNLQAGILAQWTVVLSLLVGAMLLGERLTTLQIVGCGLTLAGVVAVVWIQSTPRAVE